jgi:NADPH:quinone reductase-like Zn-dependent oxidoreductase
VIILRIEGISMKLTPQNHKVEILGPILTMTGDKKMVSLMAQANKEDLVFLKELLEAGKIVPVIDRRYPLREVPDAVCYYGEGHAQGKVVIAVTPNSN